MAEVGAKRAARRAPQQTRALATRDAILEAADSVRAADGHRGISIRAVARAAGVSIGTFYQYYPSREALMHALEQREHAAIVALVRSRLAEKKNAPLDETVRDVIEHVVNQLITVVDRYGRTTLDELPDESHDLRESTLSLVAAGFEAVAALHPDRFKPTDLRLAAGIVLHLLMGVTYTSNRWFPREVRSGVYAREIAEVVAAYLLKVPTAVIAKTETASEPE